MNKNQSSPQPKDTWVFGEAYDLFVGRWSQLVSREFLDWLAVPSGYRWLDVGCGTGALTKTLLQGFTPQAVRGIDPSEGQISFARSQITDDRATFQLGDAHALPVETATYDAAVSGLVLNFLLHPDQGVSEMARATRPGGTIAAYVWDYAGRMQFMRHFWNAAVALNPAAIDLDEGTRFPLCNPGPLADLFQGAGLTRVDVRAIDVWMVFKDFDDYWSPFLGGQGPAPSYLMLQSEEHRTELKELIRASLPFALDGSIPLIARAWAVRGVR